MCLTRKAETGIIMYSYCIKEGEISNNDRTVGFIIKLIARSTYYGMKKVCLALACKAAKQQLFIRPSIDICRKKYVTFIHTG